MGSPKKIFDILPPKEAVEPEKLFRPIQPQKRREVRFGGRVPKKMRVSPRLFVGGALLLLLLLLGFGTAIKLLEVRVYIWPVQEKWDFQEKVWVSPRVNGINLEAKIIPGRILNDIQEWSQQFTASGKTTVELKAQGTIRVYNKYHLPQTLVATTRFLSADGKLFRSKNRIVIPSGGYQDVEVEAAEPGESYNIEPTTFSVPGLAGSPRYTLVYGESSQPMTGGKVAEALQVTGEDIEKAKKSVEESLRLEGRKKIQTKISSDEILLEEAFLQEVGDISSIVKPGTEVEYFNVQGSSRLRAMVFKKSDMEQFAKSFLKNNLPEGKEFDEKSLAIKVSFEDIDWEAENMKVILSISANFYPTINLEDIKLGLSGKSIQDGITFLKGQPVIDRSKIEFWPLSIGKIPKDLEKINIILKLD